MGKKDFCLIAWSPYNKYGRATGRWTKFHILEPGSETKCLCGAEFPGKDNVFDYSHNGFLDLCAKCESRRAAMSPEIMHRDIAVNRREFFAGGNEYPYWFAAQTYDFGQFEWKVFRADSAKSFDVLRRTYADEASANEAAHNFAKQWFSGLDI